MTKPNWDLAQFNQINLPVVVGELNPQRFVAAKGTRVLDLPLHIPGQGWRIPTCIMQQFGGMLDLVIAHETEQDPDVWQNHYCYITVDQKHVQGGTTGRRAGAHSDAYIESRGRQIDIVPSEYDAVAAEVAAGERISMTYIAYDTVPTEFFKVKFPLTDPACDQALHTFDQIAATAEVITYPAFTVLALTPYVVHRSAITPVPTYRTFVKISVSTKRYARQGNTINPAFTYDWQMTARSPDARNHPWAA